MRRILAVFVAEVLALTSLAGADLPVREVVLYKHGVGYFERSGHLAAGESAHLDFQASEMNDVLKSLTIEEKGGGKISGLRYDSSQPLGAKLAEFPFRLGEGQPLSAVLDQLKGARLQLKFAAETVAGAIVAARRIPGDAKQPEREQITLLADGGDLLNFDLAAAISVRFTDPTLQAQFKDYLGALTQSRSKDKRSVYIDSSDARAREITAGYMIPTPVWKSSYRLIFDESAQPIARRLGHRRQHDRRRLDQRAPGAGFGPADFVHQRAVRTALHRAAHGRAAGRGSAGAGGLSGRGRRDEEGAGWEYRERVAA